MVPDGHGGLWALGFLGDQNWRLWHYASGGWAMTPAQVSGPADLTGLASSLAGVPGATSAWAAGGADSYPNRDGLILVEGLIPT